MSIATNINNKEKGSEDGFVMVDASSKEPEPKTTTPSISAPTKEETNASRESSISYRAKLYRQIFWIYVVLSTAMILFACFKVAYVRLERENAKSLETISKLQVELERMREVERQYIIREEAKDAVLQSNGRTLSKMEESGKWRLSDALYSSLVAFAVIATGGILISEVVVIFLGLTERVRNNDMKKKQVKTQKKVPEEDEEAEDDQEEQDDEVDDENDDEEIKGEEKSDGEESEHDDSD